MARDLPKMRFRLVKMWLGTSHPMDPIFRLNLRCGTERGANMVSTSLFTRRSANGICHYSLGMVDDRRLTLSDRIQSVSEFGVY